MIHLFPLLIIPLLIAGVAFFGFKRTITWKEFALQEVIQIVVVVVGFMIAQAASLSSTEHWNGHVTSKRHSRVSCCHCHQECVSRDDDGMCERYRTVCSHSYDNSYLIHLSTGDTVGDSCTHSGPPSWFANAYKGEPASVPRRYKNYLKADPDSLFVQGADEKLVQTIPSFPDIYGLYKVNKVVTHGVAKPRGVEMQLRRLNDKLGAKHQVDIVFLLTRAGKDPDAYSAAVERAWLYGPKNALIVVAGVSGGDKIDWARIVTISKVEMLKIGLRDELPGHTVSEAVGMVEQHIRNGEWHRVSLSEYEYLTSHASPSGWALGLLYVFSIMLSIGLSIFMSKNDVFGDERFLNKNVDDFDMY